ncbi:hypothetical protein [Fodinicurvata fenggangensis]|uniref:hypothetical protein n=1 Tax=Fodinicurvata fenggangensis TaxID=1121830 RepID=UPI00068B8ED4|nr:hypothetical protein [Fodinicurvata fenggangensis]
MRRPARKDSSSSREKPRKLNNDRRRHLISRAVEILDHGEPTRFALEGTCRHWLRANFCLQGWPWGQADELAADIVQTALNRLGASRPTWAEAQPEWTQPGVLSLPRDTCVHCGRDLPEGHFRFCSRICRQARRIAVTDRDERLQDVAFTNQAVRQHSRSLKPERTCPTCREPFQPRTYGNPADRWCSDECRRKADAR